MIVPYFKARLLSQHFPGRTKQNHGKVLIRAPRLRTEIEGSYLSITLDGQRNHYNQSASFVWNSNRVPSTWEAHRNESQPFANQALLHRKTYSWSHEMWGQRQGPFAAYRKWRTRAGCDVTRRNVERSRVTLSLSMALRHLPDGNWGTHVILTGGANCMLNKTTHV